MPMKAMCRHNAKHVFLFSNVECTHRAIDGLWNNFKKKMAKHRWKYLLIYTLLIFPWKVTRLCFFLKSVYEYLNFFFFDIVLNYFYFAFIYFKYRLFRWIFFILSVNRAVLLWAEISVHMIVWGKSARNRGALKKSAMITYIQSCGFYLFVRVFERLYLIDYGNVPWKEWIRCPQSYVGLDYAMHSTDTDMSKQSP